MALQFRRFLYRKPPDRLLEISERVFVFDSCFSTDVLEEDEYRVYMGGIVSQLQDHFPDASFMVFNLSTKEDHRRCQISDILAQYDMTVMQYPPQYEGCPLLPLEMIHHFLRSSESWLSLEGQQNVLLMHCERGGWPVLASMLAGLLLYRKQYSGEQKTLEMVYKQAPRELLHLLSPLNPQPSQLRYLQYISRRHLGSEWPPSETPLYLDCLILRVLPLFDDGKGCRPVVRVYGQDPSKPANRSSKLLFSTSKSKKHTRHYLQAECMLVKIDIRCRVQGDVVLECIHLNEDFIREEMMFRVMFHTAFVRSNMLMLSRDDIDILWDAKDHFPKDFKAEVLFLDADAVIPDLTTVTVNDDANETESAETESASPEEFYEVEEIFSTAINGQEGKGEYDSHPVHDNEVDDQNHKEVWKEELDPHTFQDCAPDEGVHKRVDEMDSGINVVKDISVEWHPSETPPLYLDCLILRVLPLFDDGKCCRPVVRVYGQDPSKPVDRSSKLLFSTSNPKGRVRHYLQDECMLVKIDIRCCVQGDVVLECIHLNEDLIREEMMFRVMFHTAFVRSNILMLSRDEIDILWDAKDQFSKDFKAEVLFLEADGVMPDLTKVKVSDDANETESAEAKIASPEEIYEVEEMFSNVIEEKEGKGGYDCHPISNAQTLPPPPPLPVPPSPSFSKASPSRSPPPLLPPP